MSQTLEIKFDDTFSREWDLGIHNEPVVYDENTAHLRSLQFIVPTVQLALTPNKSEIMHGTRITEEQQSSLIQTGIIEDLNLATIEAREDRKSVRYPPITDDPVVKQNFEDNRDDYYKTRLYQHAEDICSHIDGLIQLDKYPLEMFGQYNFIRQLVFKEEDPIIADRLLGQLIILGRSSVPPRQRYEESETIEPTIGSTTRTIEQR